jgi:hypothetical protein
MKTMLAHPLLVISLFLTSGVISMAQLPAVCLAPELPTKQLFDLANSPSCFGALAAQAALTKYAPQKRDLFLAMQNYANNQQNSSGSGTASTSTVSKPSGPTAIIEDFGGLKVTPGTSSTTFQFSPGAFLENLQNSDGVRICSAALQINKQCLPTSVTRFFLHWTVAASAQTSSTTQAATGTAGGTTSKAVSFLTGGAGSPTFAGLTVKWAAYRPPATRASTKASTLVVQGVNELNAGLNACPEFVKWRDDSAKAYDAAKGDAKMQQTILNNAYQNLLLTPRVGNSCLQPLMDKMGQYFTDYLIADAQDDLATATTPWLGLEYDFTTPLGKPSYSSAKANFSYQFGRPKAPTTPNNPKLCAWAVSVTAHRGQDCAPPSGDSSATGAKTSAAATAPAWTVSASLTADVFSSDQTPIAPSASRLRDFQGAVEIDYIIPLLKSKHSGDVLKYVVQKIGDPTLAGSYLYQDQTSPSILTGPPSSITFVGLPTTAQSAYTSRGIIHLAQLRMGFGSGTNLKFPVAVTYSNRSELATGHTFGLQLGLSYNLTSGLSGNSK